MSDTIEARARSLIKRECPLGWEDGRIAAADGLRLMLAFAAQEATPVATDGWIVGSGDGRWFRTWTSGMSSWTDQRDEATRYARRQDAESVHCEDEDAWTIVPYNPAPDREDALAYERAYFERGFIAAFAWALTKREPEKLSDAVIDHAWSHRDEGVDDGDALPVKQSFIVPEPSVDAAVLAERETCAKVADGSAAADKNSENEYLASAKVANSTSGRAVDLEYAVSYARRGSGSRSIAAAIRARTVPSTDMQTDAAGFYETDGALKTDESNTFNEDVAERATTSGLTIYIRFSDDGQHIRKWSREPFDGGDGVDALPPDEGGSA